MTMKYHLLSVVTPLFNEADNISALYDELTAVLKRISHFESYELVIVNDGSKDDSLIHLKKLAAQDPRVKIISFSRNFGHEQATFAGICHAHGDAVVLIDADLQDPPELILEFEKEFIKGYHIVLGQRTKRLNESWLKKTTSWIFYPFFKWITGVDMPRNVGDFCLLSRKVVDQIKQFNERAIFVRGLIYWLGLPKKAVPFIRRSRGAGKSKYNYSKLIIFALENIISFSTVPVYAIIFLSLMVILLCVVGAFTALCMHLGGYVIMTGWTSLIICMLFLFASTLFFLGILGLYVGKIFQEVKQRPIYIVDELINFK
jgi:dolichol-phosphate mannosyltransferase